MTKTVLKAAECKSLGGSIPSPSAMNISEAILENEYNWKRIMKALEEIQDLVSEAQKYKFSGAMFDRVISSLENEIRDLKDELETVKATIEAVE